MARKFDQKAIKDRIKSNKATMRDASSDFMSGVKSAKKGEEFDATGTRKALSDFIKAANAVRLDSQKLAMLQEA